MILCLVIIPLIIMIIMVYIYILFVTSEKCTFPFAGFRFDVPFVFKCKLLVPKELGRYINNNNNNSDSNNNRADKLWLAGWLAGWLGTQEMMFQAIKWKWAEMSFVACFALANAFSISIAQHVRTNIALAVIVMIFRAGTITR